YSGTGGYMGVSFAIPIEVALDVAKQLQRDGKVTRGRIGVGIQPVSQELARAFKLDSTDGVVVTNVEPGGPAAKAGIRAGDVSLAYNDQQVDDPNQLPRRIAEMKPGDSVKLQISREGTKRDVKVLIGEFPADAGRAKGRPAATKESASPSNQFGLSLS